MKFEFKQFAIDDHGCGMKICSDSVLLAAWFFAPYRKVPTHRIVDVGAGSGLLALFGACMCPDAEVTALEIDPAAVAAARANFEASPWADRLSIIACDCCDYVPAGNVDMVISNPPYFITGEHAADSARATARHQGSLTYGTLMGLSRKWLCDSAEGHLGLVSPAEFADDIIFAAEMAGLKLRRRLDVRTSPRKPVTRILWDFSTADGTATTATLDLRDAAGGYTEAYRALVGRYYTRL